MAKPTVYIETTIVSYLTAWPSRDVVRLSHELLTRDWWNDERPRFELYTSELVIWESSAGDPTAAAERLKSLAEHLANAMLTDKIERVCRAGNFEPPRIVTPEQLMEQS